NKNRNWEATNKDEYDPAINPTTNAVANPETDSAPKTKKDNTAIKRVSVVLKPRINVSIILSLIIFANSSFDLINLFVAGILSRMLSNTTIVLLLEYPTIVKIAATIVTSNSIWKILNITSMKKTSCSKAAIAVIEK